MNEKELRIGNLVEYFERVTPIDIVHLKYLLESSENFQPIQLTEEWLLKFGFEKSNLDEDNAWLNLKYRYLNFSSDESVEFKKVYLTINKMDIICKYIHQLQNLYFALTGEELTIKN